MKKLIWFIFMVLLILSFTSASSMRPYLVGEWRFDEGFGTTAYDSSGNGNHGSFGGNPQWTFAGKQGKALVFDGSGDYVNAGSGSSLTMTTAFTYSAWFKANDVSTYQVFLALGEGGGTVNTGDVRIQGNNVDAYWYGSGGIAGGRLGSTILTTGTWYHAAVVFVNGSYPVLYLNGISEGSITGTAQTFAGTSWQAWIGKTLYADAASNFNGTIDSARIYNKSLSAEEIKGLYNEGSVRIGSEESWKPGLVARWKFDEGSGSTTYDETSNNNDGTITGATWKTESDGCKRGNCLYFDGSGSDYVTVSNDDSLNITDAITIEAWVKKQDSSSIPVSATGGTITYDGDYTIHTFTSSGTFTVTSGGNVEVLVVAGGGGGGGGVAGGGGAGGLIYDSSYAVTTQGYPVTVGAGGAGGLAGVNRGGVGTGTAGNAGSDSIFGTNTAIGGGLGGGESSPPGGNGGSGGGQGSPVSVPGGSGGTGTIGQGSNGGTGSAAGPNYGGGGGGGAGVIGGDGTGTAGGNGGNGKDYSSYFGTGVGESGWFAGGGGGGTHAGGTPGSGGLGGGAAGATPYTQNPADSGTQNTGGGGGGGGHLSGTGNQGAGGAGGSGIVIIRYLTSSGTTSTIIGKGEDAYQLNMTGDNIMGYINSQTVSSAISSGWNHIALTYDKDAGSNQQKLYVNGELKAQGTLTEAISTNANNLIIGDDFNGSIDSVRIYDRALTQAEIIQDMHESDRPVLDMKFDNRNSTHTFDSSGNNNHGNITGATWKTSTDCKYGRCFSFDGDDDYVDTNEYTNFNFGTGDFSIEFWMKANTWDDYTTLISNGIYAGGWSGILFTEESGGGGCSDHAIRFEVAGTSVCGAVLTTGKWYHIVGVRKSGQATVYIDGVAGTPKSATGDVDTTNNLYIGKDFDPTYPRHFNGTIDSVKIYDRALTQREISMEMMDGRHNPVLDIGFDEGGGNTAYDSSFYSNDGSLNGPTWKTKENCISGYCLSFDGSDDYVTVSDDDSLNITDAITIEAWVKKQGSSSVPGVSATGGTITYDGDYTIHTFTSSEDFTVTSGGNVDVLVVAGGGGGGGYHGGGGGGGGVIYKESYSVTSGIAHTVVVGAGGVAATAGSGTGDAGANSVFDTLTALGGGAGISQGAEAAARNNGGSGGGGCDGSADVMHLGGQGTSGQGFAGGFVLGSGPQLPIYYATAGGGGAGGLGTGPQFITGGQGGPGLSFNISGASAYYGGGGGGTQLGTGTLSAPLATYGLGGIGGGGNGGYTNTAGGAAVRTSTSGTPNTGGGGGGYLYSGLGGGAGGSGIVIIRYLTPSGTPTIIGKGEDAYQLNMTGDNITGYINSQTVSTSGTANKWQHVVLTYDGSIQKLYIDGEQKDSASLSGAINTNTEDLWIGNNFNGLIDSVKIYPYALTPEEIKQGYNQGLARIGSEESLKTGLVGRWKFDEGGGNTTYDETDNNNDGTITGATWKTGPDCKYGRCFSFDGSGSDYVTVSDDNSLDITDALTLEAWVKHDSSSVSGVSATGGTITYDGDYTIHTFTSSGTFTVTSGGNVDVLVVAGGGGGGGTYLAGGGGAGGYRTATGLAVTSGSTITVTVGAGGAGGIAFSNGFAGGSSVFGSITSAGGGFGVSGAIQGTSGAGGSGGGACGYSGCSGGLGTSGQGNNGGGPGIYGGGGGGGAGSTGSNGQSSLGGAGGTGLTSTITGSAVTYATGGKGGSYTGSSELGLPGAVNTGNGGGGSGNNYAPESNWLGGNGGSGIVIIRYLTPLDTGTTSTIIGKGEDAYQLNMTGDNITGYINSQTVSGAISSGWNHIALTYDKDAGSNQQKLYVDGVLKAQGTLTEAISTNANNLIIGDDFNGSIDDVRIYDRALTQAEIIQDMHESDRPVLDMDFDLKNSTHYLDKSGNNNDGTPTGTVWKSAAYCKSGRCVEFNGSGDYVDTGIFYNTDNPFSLSGWAKTTDKSLYQAFFGTNANTATNRLYVGLRTGHYWIGAGDTQKYTVSATAITNNIWFHWALIGNGTNAYYYINGEQVDSTAYNGQGLQTGESNVIGAVNVNTGIVQFFNGLIDQVKIYDRALTQAEISYLYNKGQPVGWWRFDEGSGTTAYDSSGEGNTGTFGGDPQYSTNISDCPMGYCLEFDGDDDYINIGDIDLSGEAMIEAWINTNTVTDSQKIVSRYTLFGSKWELMFYYSGGNFYLRAADSGGGYNSDALSIETGEWYHVAAVHDSSNTWYFYLNGQDIGTASGTTFANDDSDARIGEDPDGGDNFNGTIDDVRIYNYARTQEQVEKDYNKGLVKIG